MARKRVKLAYNAKVDVNVSEHLRYAGIISIDGNGHSARIPYLTEKVIRQYRKEGEVTVIMDCPKDYEPEAWAKMNVNRLASFGIKAFVFNGD